MITEYSYTYVLSLFAARQGIQSDHEDFFTSKT